MRLIQCLLLVLAGLCAQAQNEQWASNVLGVSSEYTAGNGQQYRAIQILGKPNKLPQGESGASAWRPEQPDKGEEWIKVGFETPIAVRQIAIGENSGAGCITTIFAYDTQNKEYNVYTGKPETTQRGAGMLRVWLPQLTTYKITSLKIVLDTKRVKDWNEIDAVAISASETPIEAQINLAKNVPKELKKENLGPNVNSKANEVAPVISPDGKTIYYTRYDHPENLKTKEDYDVWFAEEKGGVWQKARNMGTPVNNTAENSICYISPDDRTALLMNIYRPDGTLSKGVSISRKNKNGWTFPQELRLQSYVNEHSFSGFYISPNGKIMVLSLQDANTKGGADLYVSRLQNDGTWSPPANMGADLNTADDEFTPFLATDNQSIYFTSNGRSGYGEMDIYVSRRLDESWTKWSEPENLGPAFNTSDYEAHFTIPASGSYAYFCSSENSLGEFDIFRIKLPESVRPIPTVMLQGSVVDDLTKQAVAAEVIVEDLDQKQPPQRIDYDPAVGDFKVVLDTQKQYGLTAQRKGYQAAGTIVDLTKEKQYREIRREIPLTPIEIGKKITLNTIRFAQSKFDLLPSSLPELDRLAQMMAENGSMEIMLEGHTDNVGDFDANVQLSKDRVEEVKRYITTKNISAARIQTKGYGPTRPIAPNTNEESRKLNRRVEFSILKM
ncbi:OmpA family protein [Runella sp.]|uniref:OmpA family protein n=1 Tax=Runella sp. TaxID=1960881 RepID=UPI003D143E7C